MSMPSPHATVAVCILAGGLSQRMRRDKSRLRLGRRTMLGHIRFAAEKAGLSVRVVRRDGVPRCGPLGGIYTALATTRTEVVLFLACDMPFVTAELIDRVRRALRPGTDACFVRAGGHLGFPLAVRKTGLPVVAAQMAKRQFSLNALARVLRAKIVPIPARLVPQLHNVNTPEEFGRAARRFAKMHARPGEKCGIRSPK